MGGKMKYLMYGNVKPNKTMPERKIYNFKSIILAEETIKEYGYHPDKYGPSSIKFIIASCRYCGKLAPIRKAFFNKSGSACHKECRLKEQSECGSPFLNKEVRDRSKKTNLERYGVEHACQNKEIGRRISKSKQKDIHPPAFLHLKRHFTSLDIQFSMAESIILFPRFNYAISCHWNGELIKKENMRKCREQTKDYKKRGIHIFHIFEHQWPSRKRQILNFVSSNLGLNDRKIAGRKCGFNSSKQNHFFRDYHIQGAPSLVLKYFNLVYDGEVVASMTASKHHRQNAVRNSVVLSRLCFADGCNVQGGVSKLFKRFKEWAKNQGYQTIISWSDSAWTVGNIYGVLEFELKNEYSSDYFYWDVAKHRYISKQSQQKKKTGCPDGMTEREWCIERGLYRIWDCGKKLWSFNIV